MDEEKGVGLLPLFEGFQVVEEQILQICNLKISLRLLHGEVIPGEAGGGVQAGGGVSDQ